MKTGVSKKEFIAKFEELLKLTREGVVSLTLYDDDTVIVSYVGGFKESVNIAADSGMAIIRDVARRVG